MASINFKMQVPASRSDGDILLSYNIYSDQPSIDTLLGNITVAENVAGKLITVPDGSTHNITSKGVYTTSGENALATPAMQIDLSGVTGNSFEDDFENGSTINPQWTVTHEATANSEFTQGSGILTAAMKNNASQTLFATNMLAESDTITIPGSGQERFFAFDLRASAQGLGKWGVGVTKDIANLTANQDRINVNLINGTQVRLVVKRAAVNEGNEDVTLDISSWQYFRVRLTDTTVQFFTWNGSAWVQLGVTITPGTALTGDYYPMIYANDFNNGTNDLDIDNFIIRDTTWATLRP